MSSQHTCPTSKPGLDFTTGIFQLLPTLPLVATYVESLLTHLSIQLPEEFLTLQTLYNSSMSCDILSDPVLYRAIFLTVSIGFFCMSNIAPHSAKNFDSNRHYLRQDLIFAHPGAHLLLKWTKTSSGSQGLSLDPASSSQKLFCLPSEGPQVPFTL